MKFAAIGLLALSGMVWAAPDLNESYTSLKEAVDKRDVAQVKALSAKTAKEALELAAEAQPAEAGAVEAWKARVQFGKDAQDYSEYALAITAIQAGNDAATIDLTETLMAQNPKSKQIDAATASYLAALNKQGAAKALAGANKIIASRPENEDALYYVAANGLSTAPGASLTAANKLVAVMRTKAKPEGTPDADWDKKKSSMTGAGYYFAGVVSASQQRWADADRNLKAALPLIGGQPAMAGPAYFYLGFANYQLGKVTQDKARMLTGIKYIDQSAGMGGPMQAQAATNSAAMKREMATPAGRR